MREDAGGDVRAIRELVARQFSALSWGEGRPADWTGFAADFHPQARLFPSARPAATVTVDAFVERMRGLAGGTLARFDERVAGCEIRVFGAVAVASVACEAVENGTERTANVEMMLLVKDDGRWRIVAQAWDRATKDRPLPDDLVRDSGDGGA